jgi:PAS domain S-box-containing protein
MRVRNQERDKELRVRGVLLVGLRVLLGLFLCLLAWAALHWPFEQSLLVVDRCMVDADPMQLPCVHQELLRQVAAAANVRIRVLGLVGLIILTVTAAFLTRLSLRAQLQDQLNFSEALIDALPLAVSIRSPQGLFIRVNKAFQEKYGLTQAQAFNQPVSVFFTREQAERVARMDAKAISSGLPVEQEFESSNRETPRHVLVRAQSVQLPGGKLVGIVGVQTDVTALRSHQASLTEKNEKLRRLAVQMIHAQEAERLRLARDLHDQVGQILTALKLQLRSIAGRGPIQDPAAVMRAPLELAEEALGHTRDLSASLHPHLLDDLGLEPALNWLVERFIVPSVPDVEIRCRLDPARGAPEIELVAFRVVQEALTNVVRHAGATRIGVFLRSEDAQLAVEVIDDGVGFDAGSNWFELQRKASLGVTNMHDRVTEIGGDVSIDSTPGVGTSVRAWLPWNRGGNA